MYARMGMGIGWRAREKGIIRSKQSVLFRKTSSLWKRGGATEQVQKGKTIQRTHPNGAKRRNSTANASICLIHSIAFHFHETMLLRFVDKNRIKSSQINSHGICTVATGEPPPQHKHTELKHQLHQQPWPCKQASSTCVERIMSF